MKNFQKHLEGLKDRNRFRTLSISDGFDLTSNDYMGMADHPALREAGIEFLQNDGDIGAGGSRLLRGHTQSHADLEIFAGHYFAAPGTLYFSSGFQANAAVFQALPTRHDTIVFDEFVHASARESIQNSDARRLKARHNNLESFEKALIEAQLSEREQIWIAVESVYSMDGDVAPLAALYDLAVQYDAILIVDEAHGTGVCGPTGKGVSESLIARYGYERLVTLHTCGKAIGVAGGLICAREDIISTMVNGARGFIYSTAPMPLQACLVRKSLEVLGSEEGVERRTRLLDLAKKAQQKFGGAGTHIVPIIIGDDDECVNVAEKLQQKGWDIRPIRPPTVPEGTARLRLSLSVNLDEAMLEKFAADLEPLIKGKAA